MEQANSGAWRESSSKRGPTPMQSSDVKSREPPGCSPDGSVRLPLPQRLPHSRRMSTPEPVIARRLGLFPEVERVILFGSRARGDAAARADIDLAVECPTADARRWSDIQESVEQAPTLLQIDLVRLDTAPDELASVIRSEGRILYDRAKRPATA